MKWLRHFLSFAAVVNMVLAPLATHAGGNADITPEQIRDTLEAMGYGWKIDEKAGKILVFDKSTNKQVMDVDLASDNELRKYSPKSLNQRMLEEITRVRSVSKASWSHSVKALPMESTIFFMAMGAVVAGQLLFNYTQNPVGMKQHLDHSMSPLGVFGFFIFMYSQGVTSNVLSMYLKNPKYHHMIPYLGMTVGAFTQTYLSSFATDPNVKACAASWISPQTPPANLSPAEKKQFEKENTEACDKAYEYFLINKKIWEFAPGIASMLISSAVAAAGQGLLTKAILRVTGVDIALWLTPGTMQLKGMRMLLVKGLQITAFVAIDALIMRKVTYVWKNMFDGKEFYNQNDRLNDLVNQMKKAHWRDDEKPLIKEVKHLRERMSDWRMMNMSEVYEAHQNWQQALEQLTAMFNTSYAVYNDTIAEIRNIRFNESAVQPLTMPMLLAGVKAKGLPQDKQEVYLLRPDYALGMQLETAKDAGVYIRQTLGTRNADFFVYPQEEKKLSAIAAQLESGDEKRVYQGLQALKSLQEAVEYNTSTQDALRIVQGTMNILGSPVIPRGPGQGFFATYESVPSSAENLRGAGYYRVTGAFQTPKITDHLVVQMLCGPDVEADGKVVRNAKGFPMVFAPPQITPAGQDLFACNAIGANLPAEQIYSYPMEVGNKTYHGAVSYLAQTARPSIVGNQDTEAFEDWWKIRTEKQMMDAFEVYSKEYQSIVAKLMEGLFTEGKSMFNGRPPSFNPWSTFKAFFDEKLAKRNIEGGPIMNGGMDSSFQEMHIYLSLLEEIMKPSKNFDLDFGATLKKTYSNPLLQAVEKEFKGLETLIRRIKVTKVDGSKVVSSDLENYELEEQTKKIQEVLTAVSQKIGVGDEANPSIKNDLPLGKRELAVQTIEQLEALSTEIMMFGAMANAVTWEKIRDLKRINMEQEKYNNEIQAKMNQMRGVLGARH